MASLIQQRMAIERRRTSGLLGLVAGVIFVVVAITQATSSLGSSEARVLVIVLINVVLALIWLSFGLMNLRRFRREIAAFTAANGPEAGKR